MIISKRPRKDCLGCKCNDNNNFCQLGYQIGHKTIIAGVTKMIPIEPCPKPLTNKDWLAARKYFKAPIYGG